jgi:hypothetical protein
MSDLYRKEAPDVPFHLLTYPSCRTSKQEETLLASLKCWRVGLVLIEDTAAIGVCLYRHLGDCANCDHHGRSHRRSGARANESVHELGAD